MCGRGDSNAAVNGSLAATVSANCDWTRGSLCKARPILTDRPVKIMTADTMINNAIVNPFFNLPPSARMFSMRRTVIVQSFTRLNIGALLESISGRASQLSLNDLDWNSRQSV
jgi:hypothetical protein